VKYQKTLLNQLVLMLLIVSLLFFAGLYLLTGSGPWDVFVYIFVLMIILGIWVLDLLIQFVRDLMKN